MKTLILFIVVFLCSFNIQNSKVTKANPDNFFQIKYETLLKKKEIISLSQIASNIEYIQLETKDECLLWGGVKNPDIYYTEFAVDKNNKYLYTIDENIENMIRRYDLQEVLPK